MPRSWSCPRCRQRFAAGEREPCPDAATATVRDPFGGAGRMCRSHAVRAVVQIVDSTAEDLDAEALAVAAVLPARDLETAAQRARDDAQELAELEGQIAPLDPERRAAVDAFNNGTHSVFRAYGLTPSEAAHVVARARKLDRNDDDEP